MTLGSSDGATPHYRLQGRKSKKAWLIALVVCSNGVNQGAPPILHIDNHHSPDREG